MKVGIVGVFFLSNSVKANPFPPSIPSGPQLVKPESSPPPKMAIPRQDSTVEEALSHYRKGLKEMERDHQEAAEREFRTALKALSMSEPEEAPEPHKELKQFLAKELSNRNALVRSPSVLESGEGPEEAEPEEEAPALVSPEDVEALEEAKVTPPSPPEPEAQEYDVPIVLNEQVKAYIRFFQTSKWGVVSRAFQRASRYLPMIRGIFEEMGLPKDLINLAFIESAFNPWARSKANAVGIWQFIESTGRRYGLAVNRWIDERRDPEKATRAAASYLKNLYEMFSSWELALAAYNAGEQRIQAAIERQRTRDFWSLKLPKETMFFVPAFMAMTIIAKDPERYGFSPPGEEPLQFERVTVEGPMDLRLVAKAAKTSLEVIRGLNPELTHGVIPPFPSGYTLKLPPGVKEEFLLAIAQIPKDQRANFSRHLVKKGETLKKLAKRYRVPSALLAELNGLEPGEKLQVGSSLLLPFPADQAPKTPAPTLVSLSRPQSKAVRQAGDGARPSKGEAPHRHRVKKGESLWRIARTYDVSVEDLKRWNGLDGNDRLHPGQILLIAAQGAVKADPPKVPQTKKEIMYIVKRGDSLWRIAEAHSVRVEDLLRWNDLTPKSKLRPGQKLRLLTEKVPL